MADWFRKALPPLGKTLVKVHKWNAWFILLTAISGIVLSIGSIRGDLGEGRVWLKQVHIWSGVVLILLLIIYLPYIRRHLRQIRHKPNQKINLAIVLLLFVGWIVSGIILWQFRLFIPEWSNVALAVHDIFSWVGISYGIFHSIVRLRWLKTPAMRTIKTNSIEERSPSIPTESSVMVGKPKSANKPFYTRRQFIKWTIGIASAVMIGPKFLRWLNSNLLTDGSITNESLTENDNNQMHPQPVPMAGSVALIGGGSTGSFRVYTVTDVPTFTSESWTFIIDGLVDHPQRLNWQQFLNIKRVVKVIDFNCVTGWSVYNSTWEGILLTDLLTMAGVQSKAKFVKFYSGDHVYTDSLSCEIVAKDEVVVAVLREGKPIPQLLGGPVRLVVPKMYTYKSVKWLNRIELIAEDELGYWEVRGYDNNAWLQT